VLRPSDPQDLPIPSAPRATSFPAAAARTGGAGSSTSKGRRTLVQGPPTRFGIDFIVSLLHAFWSAWSAIGMLMTAVSTVNRPAFRCRSAAQAGDLKRNFRFRHRADSYGSLAVSISSCHSWRSPDGQERS
jgi:hypothetical protein